jgi:riboflavin kinase/FMN adenylyltransferase
VHLGHQVLLKQAIAIAKDLGGSAVTATFDPHPTAFLRPLDFQGLLTLPPRRQEILEAIGIDRVEVLNFDLAMSQMSPECFVEEIIVKGLQADVILVGENFRFGHKAVGDVETLIALTKKLGIEVRKSELFGDSQVWSSTRIRKFILSGDVTNARMLLGRPHRVSGEVVHGDHRGRELGFPTANLDVGGGLIIPADGVYSGVLHALDEAFPAAISIGTNPTFEGVIGRRVEAHVLGRTDLDLYGQILDLDFIGHIRSMQAFDGIESLVTAMNRDVEMAKGQISDFLNSSGKMLNSPSV